MDIYNGKKQNIRKIVLIDYHFDLKTKKIKHSIKHLLFLLILLTGCVIFQFSFLLQSWSSQPSRHEHAFDWKPIKQATQHFFKGEASQFIKEVELSLESAQEEIFRKGLSRNPKLFRKIVHLIRPMLVRQDIDGVKGYFNIINTGEWIVGWHSSPDYGGDTVVYLGLEVNQDKEYRVVLKNWATKNDQKRPVISFEYSTGVRALPIFQQDDQIIFSNVNTLEIRNQTWGDRQGPENPTVFTINQPYLIHEISTGHWPYKPEAETGTIQLIKNGRNSYGPWPTKPLGRFGGYNTVFWLYRPKIILKPGTYQIVDSDPDTWINNDISDRQGMSWIIGSPIL